MNLKLFDRRETLLRYMVRGARLKDAAEEITKNISDLYERRREIAAIYKDWGRRDSWIDNIVRVNDTSRFAQSIALFSEIKRRAWIEYATADNSNAKVGALRVIMEAEKRSNWLFIKTGRIRQVPQQIESTITLTGTPFDCDPELKQAIIEERERQMLEKQAKHNVGS